MGCGAEEVRSAYKGFSRPRGMGKAAPGPVLNSGQPRPANDRRRPFFISAYEVAETRQRDGNWRRGRGFVLLHTAGNAGQQQGPPIFH